MKRVNLLFFVIGMLLISSALTGETVVDPTLKQYSEVIDVPSVNASTLFTKANSWLVDSFKNAESVIQYSDKDAGIIKGKYVEQIGTEYLEDHYIVSSTITIEVKDNKYRVTFSEPYGRLIYSKMWGVKKKSSSEPLNDVDMLSKLQTSWKFLAADLKSVLSSSSNEEW